MAEKKGNACMGSKKGVVFPTTLSFDPTPAPVFWPDCNTLPPRVASNIGPEPAMSK